MIYRSFVTVVYRVCPFLHHANLLGKVLESLKAFGRFMSILAQQKGEAAFGLSK